MKTAISIKGIWKKYKIGHPKKLGDSLSFFLSKQKIDEFWALKNVSLKINSGETVGIIGPNGSGKSTILKILSGVTTPTKGSISISGKVASLLEVGTGFHPDFTGRENIYLYGTVLGMNLPDVKNKFEEIVEFSGVRKFLDTPVKRYSSGMYVRLAFSVAVSLEWDILLLDEVLTVGDKEFQKKSYEKITSLINSKKTVLLVTHDLEMIKKLCEKVVLLKNGRVEKIGKAKSVIDYYLRNE